MAPSLGQIKMSWKVNIHGRNQRIVEVTNEGALLVTSQPRGKIGSGETLPVVLFSQFCTDTGLVSGSKGMNVDGSVTNRVFKISADAADDLAIYTLMLYLVDDQMQYSRFGFLTALVNGFQLYAVQEGVKQDIVTNAQTCVDLIRYARGNFVDLNNIDASNNDAILLRYDLSVELRLRAGTLDRVECLVRDNLTALVGLECLGLGGRLR